jgi:outer membrane protein assembly factor BamE (lipoprotein component of BamABCDE complex)
MKKNNDMQKIYDIIFDDNEKYEKIYDYQDESRHSCLKNRYFEPKQFHPLRIQDIN